MSEPPGRLDECMAFVRHSTPGADALGRLAAATRIAAHLTDLADRLVGVYVDEARAAGASWAEIGRSLGVTKQAAQRRFVGSGAGAPPAEPWNPPEWMSADLVTLIKRAQHEARTHGASHVTVEHLVLAALRDPDGAPYRAVRAVGIAPEAVRDAIVATIPPPGEPVGSVSFTARAKEMLDARRVAKRLGDTRVRPDHVLVNVLSGRKGEPVLAILNTFGVTDKHVVTWMERNNPQSPPFPRS